MPKHRIGLEEGIPFRTRVARSRHKLSKVQGIQTGKVIALGDCRKFQLHFEGLAAPIAQERHEISCHATSDQLLLLLLLLRVRMLVQTP